MDDHALHACFVRVKQVIADVFRNMEYRKKACGKTCYMPDFFIYITIRVFYKRI